MHIKGDIQGHEDIRIDGTVEGSVSVEDHCLAIGEHGHIQADISARSVIVEGQVVGNITAEDRVEVAATGSVLGNIRAARVVLAEGARFKGSIDMGSETVSAEAVAPPPPPAPAPAPADAVGTRLASLFGNKKPGSENG